MTDGMSENAREIREARGHAAAAGAKRERELGVPEDETPREKVQRLRVERRLAQVRGELVQQMASFELRHANAIAKLRLRCTNLENANAVLQASLDILAPDRARNQAIDKIPRLEPSLREQAAAMAAAPAPPPEDEEELDPAEEEAIHAAELRARDEAMARRVRDNPSPPPVEDDEDDGNYDFEPTAAPWALPGYDESNPADRKMRDLVVRGRLRVEQRAQREVVVPGPEGSRSDIFENKDTFKLLTRRFFFDSANKLWGRDVVA